MIAMIIPEQARKIELDDDYLLAAYQNADIKVVGYDPIAEGQEFAASIQFRSEPEQPLFELLLTLDGKWWLSVEDSFAASKKQLGQLFKTQFFKKVKDEVLKKLLDLQKNQTGKFVWIDEFGKQFNSSYAEYSSSISKAIKALQSPARNIDTYTMKIDEGSLDKRFSESYSVKLDSYHMKQLPSLLKRIFKGSFDDVKLSVDSSSRIHLEFYASRPDVNISQAYRIERVVKLIPDIRRILDYVLRSQNVHVDFNHVSAINTSRSKSSVIQEGEGGVAPSGGDAGSSSGIQTGPDISPGPQEGKPTSTEDVLGKFDKDKGCMGRGDFHIPCILPLGGYGLLKRRRGKKSKKDKKQRIKVIKNYDDLTEAEISQLRPILVYNLPHDHIEEILDNTTIENKRYNKQQFMKFIDAETDGAEYVGLFSKFPMECFGMAVLSFDRAGCEDCYVAEIQSFKRGFGQDFLLKIIRNNQNTWLCCNPQSESKLLDFYRRPCFNFREHVVENSIWNNEAHFFYTKNCDEEKLLKYIDNTYSRSAQQ